MKEPRWKNRSDSQNWRFVRSVFLNKKGNSVFKNSTGKGIWSNLCKKPHSSVFANSQPCLSSLYFKNKASLTPADAITKSRAQPSISGVKLVLCC